MLRFQSIPQTVDIRSTPAGTTPLLEAIAQTLDDNDFVKSTEKADAD